MPMGLNAASAPRLKRCNRNMKRDENEDGFFHILSEREVEQLKQHWESVRKDKGRLGPRRWMMFHAPAGLKQERIWVANSKPYSDDCPHKPLSLCSLTVVWLVRDPLASRPKRAQFLGLHANAEER